MHLTPLQVTVSFTTDARSDDKTCSQPDRLVRQAGKGTQQLSRVDSDSYLPGRISRSELGATQLTSLLPQPLLDCRCRVDSPLF